MLEIVLEAKSLKVLKARGVVKAGKVKKQGLIKASMQDGYVLILK